MRATSLVGRLASPGLLGVVVWWAGAMLGGCAVADLPPLDTRDGDAAPPDATTDSDDGRDGDADEPPPWACDARPRLALQWGGPRDDEASALLFAGERLWVGGYLDGRRDEDPLPSGDARAFVLALGASPAGLGTSGLDAALPTLSGSGLAEVARVIVDLPGVSDAVEALAERDGVLYVLGRTRGVFPGQRAAGHYDAFLGRLGGDGRLGPVVQFGSEAPQHPRQLVPLGEDWLVGGFDDIDVDGNYVRKWPDPIRAVVSGDLTTVDYSAGTTLGDDYGGPVLATPDGSGYFVATFSDLPPERGAWVTRYSRVGEVVWRRAITRGPLGNVAAIRWLGDSLVAAGTTYETLAEGGAGGQDLYVATLDPATGEVTSVVQTGSPGDDWVMDMQVGDDGAVHVYGETTGSFEEGGVNRGDYDLFVVSVKDGEVVRRWGAGTRGDERSMALALDPCGRV